MREGGREGGIYIEGEIEREREREKWRQRQRQRHQQQAAWARGDRHYRRFGTRI